MHSPKTEHHPGQESRLAPLVPELLPCLREAFERAEPGTENVITRYRLANQNLQTQLRRILRRAGIKPWPKLYQNLRSTRQTELTDRFPVHVVCAWLGNRAPVVMKHCLQVTDEHFRQAAQKAVQKAVQPPSAATCRNPPAEPGPKEETVIVASGQQVADTGNDLSTELVGAGGHEHPAKTPVKPQNPGTRGTESGTVADAADVADLAARLAALPEAARQVLADLLRNAPSTVADSASGK